MLFDRRVLRQTLSILLRDFRKTMANARYAKSIATDYQSKPLDATALLDMPGDKIIAYTSRAFQPYVKSLPNHIHYVGWAFNAAPPDDTFPLDQFQHQRLIYVSLGTVNNDNFDFFKLCIEALGGRDETVIITTGGRFVAEDFGQLPANIHIYEWVPQSALLPHIDLFIMHGGLNSIHDSLTCGVPLLMIPQQLEQTVNALRVADLGAGIILKPAQLNVASLRANVATLLTDEKYGVQAQQIGATLRNTEGMSAAIDEIEALLQQK